MESVGIATPRQNNAARRPGLPLLATSANRTALESISTALDE